MNFIIFTIRFQNKFYKKTNNIVFFIDYFNQPVFGNLAL